MKRSGQCSRLSDAVPNGHESLSFNYSFTAGGFFPPRVEGLCSVQIRVVVGSVVVLLVPKQEMDDEWPNLGSHWNPRCQQRSLPLNKDDVLYVPPGIVHTFIATEPAFVVGKLILHDSDLLETLDGYHKWATKYPNCTHMGHTNLQITPFPRGLSEVVRENPQRFAGELSNQDFLIKFQNIVGRFAGNRTSSHRRQENLSAQLKRRRFEDTTYTPSSEFYTT